jgi:hypothetical protein
MASLADQIRAEQADAMKRKKNIRSQIDKGYSNLMGTPQDPGDHPANNINHPHGNMNDPAATLPLHAQPPGLSGGGYDPDE